MALIHHVVAGDGGPAIVFVHGFGCASSDWTAQIDHFSSQNQTIAVDLRGHGATPGTAEDCSIERYGADVVKIMRIVAHSPAVLVGHSMGCRVVIESALQAPTHAAGVVLIDGSQFAPAMEAALKQRFATPDGYAATVRSLFADMFTPKSDPAVIASIAARAERVPRPIGEKMLLDMQRYDVGRLAASLGCLRVPVMVLQTTYSNDKRERRPLRVGQNTPYLNMIRTLVPSAQVETIPETGHFPQLEQAELTNALIGSFVANLPGQYINNR